MPDTEYTAPLKTKEWFTVLRTFDQIPGVKAVKIADERFLSVEILVAEDAARDLIYYEEHRLIEMYPNVRFAFTVRRE